MATKYPFTPEVLDALPEQIAELYRGLENRLLQEICSRLKISGEMNEVTVLDIKALRSHGISLKDIEKAITETASITEKELDAMMDDVVARNNAYSGKVMDKTGVTKPAALLDASEIDAIKRQTKLEVLNITQTAGFAIRKTGKVVELTPPAQVFHRVLNTAEVEIMSGAISYRQAIERAVRELADGGLKKVTYDNNGRVMLTQTDVAVRRAVLTGINQINDKYTEQLAERLETELFEVSAHVGARDTGDGWQNHAEWQGKVYSTRSDDPKYPSIYEVCGLGMVDGLEGANCRHRRFPFVDGISERAYTDDELKNIDRPAFSYSGHQYTAYEATQKQREMERTVRKHERRRIAYESAGLTEEASAESARIRQLKKTYKDFSGVAGLPEQRERMKVVYPD